ncbi:MAG TPA: aldo/keto reductase [Methanocorpusculum sp.]|nr:aldo/keto reductase [Methanocorpusculum sp.]HJJ40499.1 aldo/keto reductase [Methanocorpusculum sp.]HJJ49884.1 aldo/keto reductase [Methanocorpusculum sp.]HJJ57808.1 aldo/keto reductase [Methanocorpusculum sp.]
MEYRTLGRTGLSVSVVGIGGEYLEGKTSEEVTAAIDAAIAGGMNYLDIFMSEPQIRTNLGLALKGRREKMFLQGHIGATFEDGQYKRSRDLQKNKEAFEDLLTRLQTDYLDVGMIHYVDDDDDFDSVFNSEILQYALSLKEQGVIHYLGLSSHNPEVALKAVKTGFIDVLMFSINPAFDFEESATDIYEQKDCNAVRGASGLRMNPARNDLYTACEALGVGIVVMKPFGGGILLDSRNSPFGSALTVSSCIQYALDRPGVVSVLPGCANPEEVAAALHWLDATAEEKDYSYLFTGSTKLRVSGHCMYCGHCKPCSAHIDIPLVGKLLDMALSEEDVPDTVREHYFAMHATADDCIECHQCEPNCPFSVNIVEMMARARRVFQR